MSTAVASHISGDDRGNVLTLPACRLYVLSGAIFPQIFLVVKGAVPLVGHFIGLRRLVGVGGTQPNAEGFDIVAVLLQNQVLGI